LIPDSFKQDLLNRVDIVDIVERYVPLKKAGTNFSACCPFHSEKTPSFTVSPSKQFYHCFGCGAHGNAISFVMEYQGLGYVEAVRDLAESVGLKLPEFQPQQQKKVDAGPDLYEVLERAAHFYREQLKASPKAIEYLKRRGLTGKIAARFGIGYAPEGWQALEGVFPNYQDKSLKDAGLVIDNEAGKRYDRFRDRVMFPILNQRDSVIGFGGRVIGEGEPKYLNSPETPLFEKGRELYGLSQARLPIRESGKAVVVEGYMDVVALAQHEVGYAVATLGTATSATHIGKLLRQTDEVVFCFDGDSAGRRAAWHALEVSLPLLADQKTIRFLFLPAEDDPDSYVRAHGKEVFEARLREAWPLSEFLLTELKSRVDMNSVEGRSKLIHEARPLLQKIAAPVMQLQMLKQLAEMAGMTQDEAARLCDIHLPAAPHRSSGSAQASPRPSWQAPGRAGDERLGLPGRGRGFSGKAALMPERRRERDFLRFVMLVPDLAEKVPEEILGGESPESKVLAHVVNLVESRGVVSTSDLIDLLHGGIEESLVGELCQQVLASRDKEEDIRAEFADALVQAEEGRLDQRIQALMKKAQSDGLTGNEPDELRTLLSQRQNLKGIRSNRPAVV
jgi:DNA primase